MSRNRSLVQQSKSPPPNYEAAVGTGAVDYGSSSAQVIVETSTTVHTCTAEADQQSRPRLTIPRKLAYGVGHVFNDLCASMWFTYLVLFYHKVVLLGNTYAGLLILIGQVADALATPVIGFLCDTNCDVALCRYGRRKLWHILGTTMVAVSLFFFWHTCLGCENSCRLECEKCLDCEKCLNCENSALAVKMVYFSVFIIIFQVGWASVQISHLSLIPELASDENERVGLNAIRSAFTILSNVGVYLVMFMLLLFVKGSPSTALTSFNVWIFPSNNLSHHTLLSSAEDEISPSDVWIFSGTALGIIVVGVFFSIVFQIGTREPYRKPEETRNDSRKLKWYQWFMKPQFYAVATIYMCTRLMNNIIQAYTPLYLIESLKLSKVSVAIGPLVIYISGFLTTLVLKVLNRVVGRYMVYFMGLALIWAGLIWFQLLVPPNSTVENIFVYGPTVLVGAGGATVLVTSLSMVADLIGSATGSAAFVYGLMSFTDKLSSGAVIQIIQALHPCKLQVCCAQCGPYYHRVLVLVPGAATAVAFVALAILAALVFFKKRCQRRLLQTPPSINTKRVSPLHPPIQDGPGRDRTPLLH